MNKAEFITFIADAKNMSKTDAEFCLNTITDAFIEALAKGNEINLVGFGSFYTKHQPACERHNPKTRAKIIVEAKNRPMFRAGKKMKDACN